MSRSRLRSRFRLAVVVCAVTGLQAGVAGATPARAATAEPDPKPVVKSTVRAPAAGTSRTVAARAAGAVAPIPRGDEIVTATADTNGYHLFAASASTNWSWRPLATLRPGGRPVGEEWIGEHCLTGDGRYVVVVVAPWRAQNSAAGMAGGGLAYAVDAHTGTVRPLVAGVSLAYFNPGCGAGSEAAFTRYSDGDQTHTTVLAADASTGKTRPVGTVVGEITSAVPGGRRGVLAARGNSVVRVAGTSLLTVASALPGQVYRLSVDGAGDVHFLTRDSVTRAGAWRLKGTGATREGSVPSTSLGMSTGPKVGAAQAVSRDGQVAVPRLGARPDFVPLLRLRDGARMGGALPAAAPATTTVPAAWPPTPNTSAPTCAVPRNNPAYQVRQPSSAMIEWASNQAGRGTGTFSGEFPLRSPFDGSAHVPREVLDGVMAQESDWNQASPHAPPGMPGNPYVADYYGSYASGTVDYSGADCGYGLGQVTDGMRLTNPGDAPSQQQVDVATDYRANVARAAQILAQKWNELAGAGIIVGQGDTTAIEDWYFALWDYNSGLHPDDGQGNSGLGWANNPANPVYDPGRNPFLRDVNPLTGLWEENYGDAAHPAGWPYQEKVFGWIESSLYEPDGTTKKFAGTAAYGLAQTGFLVQPAHTGFCSLAGNSCLPGLSGSGSCQRADFHCWWHEGWIGCLLGCNYGRSTVPDGAPQPTVADPHPPVCGLSLPAGTVVVDEQASDANIVGCSPSWRSAGEFDALYNTDPSTGGPTGQIDWHQLGGGFGGHFWFTHTEPVGSMYAQTAYWRPSVPLANYEIRVFVPDLGAVATGHYEIWPGGTSPATYVDVNQNAHANQWVSLGTYELGPDGFVSLSSETGDGNGTVDLAFDAVAFTPVSVASVPFTAMGDSYSAGLGGDTYDVGTDTTANQCRRSPDAFTRQYALGSGIGINHVACSGATTANISSSGQYGEPRQIDQLPSTASTVTVTIGGNDVGFAQVLTRCITPSTTLCEDYYSQADANNVDDRIEALRQVLVQTYTTIRNKAPRAQVIAVTYPNIFHPGTEGQTQRSCLSIGAIADSDVEWLIDETYHLDDVIVEAARQAGIRVLDERYAFHDHELCTSAPWVNSLVTPPITDITKAFHPTTAGYAQMAADLNTEINNPAALTPVTWAGWRKPLTGIPTKADAITWLAGLTRRTPSTATYDSARFGAWERLPSGCNRRTAVLTRDADTLTFVKDANGKDTCTIATGAWQSPYDDPAGPLATVTGNPMVADSPVDVDHVVSKKDAWQMGADTWTSAKRIAFANLMAGLELLSVSGTTNSSKGERSPDAWTPDNSGNPAFTCDYLKMYVEVKWQWQLGVTDAQFAAINTRLSTCPGP